MVQSKGPSGLNETPSTAFVAQARFLVSTARPHRAGLLLAALLALIGSCAALAVPLGLRLLLDTVLEGNAGASAVSLFSFALLGLYFLRSVSTATGSYVLALIGERITMRLRERLYETLHRQRISFFGDQPLGDLISRLTNDISAIQGITTQTLIPTLIYGIRLIGAVSIMLVLNWRLALIVLLVGPVGGILSRLFGNRLRLFARDVQDQLAKVTSVAQEALRAIRTVKMFGRSEHELARYRAGLRSLFNSSRRSIGVGATYVGLIEFVSGAVFVVLFWYGGLEVLSGRLTAGDLAAFLLYGQEVAGAAAALAGVFTGVQAALGATERVRNLMDAPPPARDAPGSAPIENLRGAVTFSGVSHAYETGKPVLRDISFTVAPGEIVAIVGASGTGKTTLLNLLARFYDPTEGRIFVDGRDLQTISIHSLRHSLAVVPQDIELFSTTVRENIRYGRVNATGDEVEQAANDAHVLEFMSDLPDGLDTKVGEDGMKLSGGQRQRIAIARAFLRNAKIILFDEATSSLDGVSEKAVHDAMLRMRREAAVLMVAHRLATVKAADRIIVLAGGTITESGTHEELLARRGAYWTLARSQLMAEQQYNAGIAS